MVRSRAFRIIARIGRMTGLTPQGALAIEGAGICIGIAYGVWNGTIPGPVTSAVALRNLSLEAHRQKWRFLAGENVLTPVPVPVVQPHGNKVVALIQVVTIVAAVGCRYYLPIKPTTTSVNYLVPLIGAMPPYHCLPNNSIGVVAAPYQIIPEVIKAAARVVPNQGEL